MKTKRIKYSCGEFDQRLRATVSEGVNLALVGVMAWVFCFQASSGRAQTVPATLPDLKLSSGGMVYAVATQSDGKIIIGGFFTWVNNVARKNIARLNQNGSVDLSWNPAPNGDVTALAVGDESVFVGGSFSEIGGLARSRIAKLSIAGSGTADPVWNPGVDTAQNLRFVAITTNLFVHGYFNRISGLNRRWIAKLDVRGSGAVDASWDPNPNGPIEVLIGDGTNLYVGGNFSALGGLSRSYLARLSLSSGQVDPAWNPDPSGDVTAIALTSSSVIVGGLFTSVGGQIRQNLAKLSKSGYGDRKSVV